MGASSANSGRSFLQLAGAAGGSTDPAHSGWCDVLTFSVAETAEVVEPGLGPRKLANPSRRLKLTKPADGASSELKAAREWDSIVLETVEEKTTREIKFDHAVVVSVQQKLKADGQAKMWVEEVEFSYDRVTETSTKTPTGTQPGEAPAPSPARLFLQVPGIAGVSKDPAHAGWIDLTALESLDAHPVKTVEEQWGDKRQPVVVPVSDDQSGELTVSKPNDADSPKLLDAFQSRQHFDWIVVDIVTKDGSQQIRLEDVVEVMYGEQKDHSSQLVRFSYARHQAAPATKPGKKPSHHPVARANSTAATERSTINLRPPRFFELALPILKGDNGKRRYPPADANLHLTSQKGYDQSRPISEGMITDDQYCSFRFYDISEKNLDELFTATLERSGEKETIFKDRKAATYIRAARKTGKYEAAFPPGGDAQSGAQRDELLAPAGGVGGQSSTDPGAERGTP